MAIFWIVLGLVVAGLLGWLAKTIRADILYDREYRRMQEEDQRRWVRYCVHTETAIFRMKRPRTPDDPPPDQANADMGIPAFLQRQEVGTGKTEKSA